MSPARAAVAVIALVLFALPSQAHECDNDDDKKSAGADDLNWHTIVKNETANTSFIVEIDIGGNEKQKKSAAPGEEVGYLAHKTAAGDFWYDVDVKISDSAGASSITCKFKISYDNSKTWWTLESDDQTEVCGDITNICSTCKLECARNYHGDKSRWNTDFTITD